MKSPLYIFSLALVLSLPGCWGGYRKGSQGRVPRIAYSSDVVEPVEQVAQHDAQMPDEVLRGFFDADDEFIAQADEESEGDELGQEAVAHRASDSDGNTLVV